jgi:hypothetical protein
MYTEQFSMMGKLRLVYNEQTKKLEPQEVGWIHFLNPLAPYMDLWQWIKYLANRLSSPGSLSQDDAENIRKIFEEGRNQRIDEMEIEMSRDTAMGLSINGLDGADITLGSKGKTKYIMRVKYRYEN